MKIRFVFVCMISMVLVSCVSLNSDVIEDFNSEYMKELMANGEASKAYEYAEKYSNKLLGEPAFDYLYGVAAIDSEHFGVGTFALERAVILRPMDYAARLDLARAYFLTKQYQMAKKEFNAVIATQPPIDVVKVINKFLIEIELRELNQGETELQKINITTETNI